MEDIRIVSPFRNNSFLENYAIPARDMVRALCIEYTASEDYALGRSLQDALIHRLLDCNDIRPLEPSDTESISNCVMSCISLMPEACCELDIPFEQALDSLQMMDLVLLKYALYAGDSVVIQSAVEDFEDE